MFCPETQKATSTPMMEWYWLVPVLSFDWTQLYLHFEHKASLHGHTVRYKYRICLRWYYTLIPLTNLQLIKLPKKHDHTVKLGLLVLQDSLSLCSGISSLDKQRCSSYQDTSSLTMWMKIKTRDLPFHHFSVYCWHIGVFVFVMCEKEMCVYWIPTALCTTPFLHLAMFFFCFFINGPLKFWLQWHRITMDFNLNYYLLFIYRHDLYQYQKVEKKNDEIMSNNENLSFTSAKAVLSLFMSPTGKKKQHAFFRGT